MSEFDNQLPEEARVLAVQQLQTVAGVARGLTRTNDSLLVFDDSPNVKLEMERISRAREDPGIVQLRDGILNAVRQSVELWCTDASVSDVSILEAQSTCVCFSISD